MTQSDVPPVMRVPRFIGEGKVQFTQKETPRPGDGQLLVRVRANAICGSERPQFLHGSTVTPGHEAAGVVVAAGPGTRTAPGTLGAIYLMGFCGDCRSCRLGATNQCLKKRADMGFDRDGGYGPYELIDERIFFPVDASLTPADATLLLDVMGTSTHALARGRRLHPDVESLLVMGGGPVGLGVLAMARLLLGPDLPVLVAEPSPYRLNLVEQLGGIPLDVTVRSLPEELARCGRRRVDLAVDTSGKEVARRAAVDALDQRGVLVCVGHGEGLTLSVSPDLIATERAVLGSEYFRFDELPGSHALLLTHRAYLRQIVTHRFAPEELERAFQVFLSGATGKVVVEQ
jgi:threonine dehydrogenase-like Zn-dependent dehydrogenase